MSDIQKLQELLQSPIFPPSERKCMSDFFTVLVGTIITLSVYVSVSYFATSGFSEFTDSSVPFIFGGIVAGFSCAGGTIVVIHRILMKIHYKKWSVEFNEYQKNVKQAYSAVKNELFSTRTNILNVIAYQLKRYVDVHEAAAIDSKVQEYKKALLLRKQELINKIDTLVKSEPELGRMPESNNVWVQWHRHTTSRGNETIITITLKTNDAL